MNTTHRIAAHNINFYDVFLRFFESWGENTEPCSHLSTCSTHSLSRFFNRKNHHQLEKWKQQHQRTMKRESSTTKCCGHHRAECVYGVHGEAGGKSVDTCGEFWRELKLLDILFLLIQQYFHARWGSSFMCVIVLRRALPLQREKGLENVFSWCRKFS